MSFGLNPEQKQGYDDLLSSTESAIKSYIFFKGLISKQRGNPSTPRLEQIERGRAVAGLTQMICRAISIGRPIILTVGSSPVVVCTVDRPLGGGLTHVLPTGANTVPFGHVEPGQKLAIDDYFYHRTPDSDSPQIHVGSSLDRSYATIDDIGPALEASTPSTFSWQI